MDWMSTRGGDKYYRLARQRGKPSRAYFKLLHLNRKYGFLGSGSRVVDLGSSPGGWASYVLGVVGPAGRLVAVDVDDLNLTPRPNLLFVRKDIFDLRADELKDALGGEADVVLSDVAPRFTGIRSVDMARHYDLAEKALELAVGTLVTNGWFIVKLFMCAELKEYTVKLKKRFVEVRVDKPPSSRSTSSELYAVCSGLKASGT
jgi:23S rRNA (uridine2552-2'-O)-methyltransferase